MIHHWPRFDLAHFGRPFHCFMLCDGYNSFPNEKEEEKEQICKKVYGWIEILFCMSGMRKPIAMFLFTLSQHFQEKRENKNEWHGKTPFKINQANI